MATYIVEIDINIADQKLSTYIDVEAKNQNEAYKKAYTLVYSTLDIRVEKKPIESL